MALPQQSPMPLPRPLLLRPPKLLPQILKLLQQSLRQHDEALVANWA
jgi:hypothetical protein